VALVYAGGLLAGEYLQPPIALLCLASLAVTAGAIGCRAVRGRLLWLLVFLAGWTNLALRTALISPKDLRLVSRKPIQIVTIRGKLSETPSQRVFIRDDKERARWLARVEVSQLLLQATNWQDCCGSVLVLTPGILPSAFFAEQTVEVTGVLEPPPGPRAEGLFDYRKYLWRQGIYFQLKTESTNDWVLLSKGMTRPLCDRFLDWAQKTLRYGLPEEDEPLRLLWAMSLGWLAGLTNEIYEPFMQSGTMHIFAISGLHIAFIAGILVSLLRVARVARSWCGCVVIPLIWFYTAATGWQPSAIRSTIMMTIIVGGWALRRPTDLLNSLAAAGFIILLLDPQQLFGASFQLSFFVVLSIALLQPPLQRRLDKLLQTDALLPPSEVPQWKRWLKAKLRYPLTALGTSLAAWLGSLPLCAYYFHLLSPVTLLANLVIVPISSFALACNLGSLLCGNLLPWATELFNHSAWFWMWCMVRFSHVCISIPNAYIYVAGFSVFGFLAYYLVLIGAFSGWLGAPEKRLWKMAATALIITVPCVQWYISWQSERLTILPFNGSLSIYVRTPGTPGGVLIDCGASNSVQFITKPFLRAQGVNHLSAFCLTHGDLHHIGGAELVAQQFTPGEVCASPIRFRSRVYRQTLSHLSLRPGLLRNISRTDSVGDWTVLHPETSDHFPRADDNALVMRAEFNGTRVLLCSDLGRLGQNVVLARNVDLRADILITGLPSGSEAICDAFIEAVRPRIIIVADAEYPASERADLKLKERLGKKKARVIYTRSAGALTLQFKEGGCDIRGMDDQTEGSG